MAELFWSLTRLSVCSPATGEHFPRLSEEQTVVLSTGHLQQRHIVCSHSSSSHADTPDTTTDQRPSEPTTDGPDRTDPQSELIQSDVNVLQNDSTAAVITSQLL